MLINKSEKERKNSFKESLTFDFTPKNRFGHTGFHIACENGNTNIVEFLIDKSESLNFDLTSKNAWGHTGFHLACDAGYTNVVEMLINKSESLNLDLTAKDKQGYSGFQLAVKKGKYDVINMIKSKMLYKRKLVRYKITRNSSVPKTKRILQMLKTGELKITQN